jgi:hypothetical protein
VGTGNHQPDDNSQDGEFMEGMNLAELVYNAASHWVQAKKFDEFGYEVRENSQGEIEKVDDDGYKVVIEGDKHVKYNR